MVFYHFFHFQFRTTTKILEVPLKAEIEIATLFYSKDLDELIMTIIVGMNIIASKYT